MCDKACWVVLTVWVIGLAACDQSQTQDGGIEKVEPAAAAKGADEEMAGPAVDEAVVEEAGKAAEVLERQEGEQVGVGHRAPAFALKDQNGVERTLGALVEKQKVALVFYRSADW